MRRGHSWRAMAAAFLAGPLGGGCFLVPGVVPKEDLYAGSWLPLFDGGGMEVWRPADEAGQGAWKIEEGLLVNRPSGTEGPANADLVTVKQDFQNFNVFLDFNVDAGADSGIFLRGVHEIEIKDTCGRAVSTRGCGALSGLRAPSVAAERPSGEWQTLDITLEGRSLTVRLNGRLIHDRVGVGMGTGGGVWGGSPDRGPLVLQGVRGAQDGRGVAFRTIRWRRLP